MSRERTERVGDDRAIPVDVEPLEHEGSSRGAHAISRGPVIEYRYQAGCQFIDRAGSDEQAGFTVVDDLGDAGDVAGDDRGFDRHRLQDEIRDPSITRERRRRWGEQDGGASKCSATWALGISALQRNRVAQPLPFDGFVESLALRTFADDPHLIRRPDFTSAAQASIRFPKPFLASRLAPPTIKPSSRALDGVYEAKSKP